MSLLKKKKKKLEHQNLFHVCSKRQDVTQRDESGLVKRMLQFAVTSSGVSEDEGHVWVGVGCNHRSSSNRLSNSQSPQCLLLRKVSFYFCSVELLGSIDAE